MTADDSPFDSLWTVEIITYKNGAFETISNVTLRLPAKRMVMNTYQYFQFSQRSCAAECYLLSMIAEYPNDAMLMRS